MYYIDAYNGGRMRNGKRMKKNEREKERKCESQKQSTLTKIEDALGITFGYNLFTMLLNIPIKISKFSGNLKRFSCEICSMSHQNIMGEFFDPTC